MSEEDSLTAIMAPEKPAEASEVVEPVEASPEAEKPTEKPTEAVKAKEEPNTWDYHAYKDEKTKRQRLEEENAALKAKIPAAEPVKVTTPDLFTDPDGALNHVKSELRVEYQQQLLGQKVDVSRLLMEDKPDFSEAETKFMELIAADKKLGYEMLADPAPWRFAYNHIKNLEKLAKMEDLPAYESRLKAEGVAEYLKSKGIESGQDSDADKLLDNLSPSIAGSGSSRPGTRSGVDDESLKSILKR